MRDSKIDDRQRFSKYDVLLSDEDASICKRAIEVAEQLLQSALQQQSRAELAESAKLGRMMNDSKGKAFTFAMVDQVFRSKNAAASARRWRGLLRNFGIPTYFSLADRLMIRLGAIASRLLPALVMPAIASKMRADSSHVILSGEPSSLSNYLVERKHGGFRVNVNHLGEAVLGEEEAARRLQNVLSHLADPQVDYVSIKISAIFSQINLIAWDETLAAIKSRLRTLYRVAAKGAKFVNLDMEEYRDLAMTIAAFREVLDEPEFFALTAGIVLQAYLPDSAAAQRELTDWARQRVNAGGAAIKIRLVKGANLAMEAVEAEMHGWKSATYESKHETDANFRRMLEFGCQPENAAAVRLGVASHNLFDVALAITLRDKCGVHERIEFEMLEGMANHQARATRELAGNLLFYAPIVQRDDFLSAMAYLIRRLDENTAPENFLRDMFAMRPGSPQFETQKKRFVQGWADRKTVADLSRRAEPAIEPAKMQKFANEPDSDWTRQAIRKTLNDAISAWKPEPLPSLPELDSMLRDAEQAHAQWSSLPTSQRALLLNRAADLMSDQRYVAIACLQSDGSKSIADADGEVSEAIDFARYYARTADVPPGVQSDALGTIAVVSPWNFPYAIPAGGVFAALMAGNCVVLKPAPATAQTAWLLVQQLWAAGIPKDVLQFFPCPDGDIGQSLITDERIASVVLTGSYETARMFQSWRPNVRLLAETSGKNALIVTAQADRELAIKDLVRSAFGHSGQKCSAASLAILEAEVYDDPIFRRQLCDAAASLHAGPSTDPRSVVTPLVIEPSSDLRRALTTLDDGEQWLLQPRRLESYGALWTPGIKLGVRAGSWFHRTECFGPVLGLMRAQSLAEATQWQNATDYGLTAGLHSLDMEEVAWWRDRVDAGNLYVNRPITGAIVQRQPFGGWKRSCIGPGAKAGGPNYMMNFRRLSDAVAYEIDYCGDYKAAWQQHFAIEHDPSGLRCESNRFRYRPSRGVILRLNRRNEFDINRAKKASELCGVPLLLSIRDDESDADFIHRLPELVANAEFFRTVELPSDDVLRVVHAAGLNWINSPIVSVGRIELTRWLREQSVSETLHRYGQIQASDLEISKK